MSNPASGLANVRADLSSRLNRMFGLGPHRGGRSDAVFARARLEVAKVVERYWYEQEISRNQSTQRGAEPTGRIELIVPYDGEQYFTRQAGADVDGLLDAQLPDPYALIGHLLLTGHGGTNLGEVVQLDGGYGALPIRIPVGGNVLAGGPDRLRADRQACEISYDYKPRPGQLRVVPIGVAVELSDPDSAAMPSTVSGIQQVPDQIRQQVSFDNHLRLVMEVAVHIPKRDDEPDDPQRPVVKRVSLDWPTITSLRSLQLVVANQKAPLRYNPLTRSIEWWDVPMMLDGSSASKDGSLRTYKSASMELLIRQPGELFEQPSLDGEVQVEVPGRLLSGLQVRLYDGVGAMPRNRQPELTSEITTKFHLILDDAFARRVMSPYQHLFFDEVIPDEMRIADILTALRDRGFEIEHELTLSKDHRVLLATRSEGPETMSLWVYVEGRRYTAQRQRELPGGQTYTTDVESGDLRVYLCGLLPRDSRELTHEMNVLQRALRERFDRVRSLS